MKHQMTYYILMVALILSIPLVPPSRGSVNPSTHAEQEIKKEVVQTKKVPEKKLSRVQKEYLDKIVSEYKVSEHLVKEVLQHIDKYSHSVFPTREDLIAIIGIESSWRPYAVSNLKTDPAFGLTQIRPIAWKKWIADADELLHVENQIKYASKILNYNFRLTENKDDAIIAYNVGYGAWLEGKYTTNYLEKFISEKEKFRRS